MAASTSKALKSANKPQKSSSNKGKGKENISKPVQTNSDAWDARNYDDATPWNWTSLTDPSSTRIPPLFTKDGHYFFSLVGSSVKIYSSITGLVVSTLTAPATIDEKFQSDVLTSVVLNPHNAFQLITGSLDGRVMIWDFVNATLLQTINLGQPIHFMCTHEQFKGSIFVAASLVRKKAVSNDNNAVVLHLTLRHSDHTSQPVGLTAVGKIRFPTGLAISPNGSWLVASAGHKIYVAKTSSLTSGFTKYVSPERLCCLAFHPFEEYFATGDDKGVIRLWYCLNDNLAVNVRGVEKRTQTRSLHWHAHSVSSISFTPNGAYLLSGGEESVLVIWQLHTGKKEFVPRLGSQISTISILPTNGGEEEYLIGLADGTYTFVSSASLKVTRSYSRIKIDPTLSQEWPSSSKSNSAPLGVQPLTSAIVLPSSHPSSLQMYSPATSTLLSELEISPSNRVSRRDEKPIVPASVEKAIISCSGNWMATIDSRDGDVGFHSEVYLKIWSWDKNQENWLLNTRIDRPHGTEKVIDLNFNPDVEGVKGVFLVTTGNDGRIKTWRLKRGTLTGSETDTWISYATLTFRSETPTSISWAPDSSLFAISVGPCVAIYQGQTSALCQTLTSPDGHRNHSSHFIGGGGQHLLASGSKSLVLWDLIDGRVAWQCNTPLQIYQVVPHKKAAAFAVFHSPEIKDEDQHTKVSTFSVSSSTPTSTRSVPFGLRAVISASFLNDSGFNFVAITHSWKVVVFGESQHPFKDRSLHPKGLNVSHQPQRQTLFQDIFGVSAFAPVPLAETPSLRHANGPQEILQQPAYSSPPLNDLFDSLIRLFLTDRPPEIFVEEDQNPEDLEDDDMQDELSATAPLVTRCHHSRSTNPGEMEAFTKLFRSSIIDPTSMLHGKTNGVQPTNAPQRVGGDPIQAKREAISKANNTQRFVEPPPSLSPLSNGKKREKNIRPPLT